MPEPKKPSKGKKGVYWTDKHAAPISNSDLVQVDTLQDGILHILRPLKIQVTPQERKNMPKMGEKTLEFGEKLLEFLDTNPSFCPPFVNKDDIRKDMSDVQRLWGPMLKAEQTYQILFDRNLIARSEAYQRFLAVYDYIGMLADRGDIEAEKARNELKSRFAVSKKDKKDDEDTDTAFLLPSSALE